MAAPTDGGSPVETGSDGDLEGVDLRALVARVEQCEKRTERCERIAVAVVETLDRDLRFAAKELRTLLT